MIASIEHRVQYAETDQMRVVYHAEYLVWMEMARTEYMRATGSSYREVEARGLFLVVTDVGVRYRQPATYDELVRIRCWVRDRRSRTVIFGYAMERASDGNLLATGHTGLVCLNGSRRITRLPPDVAASLAPVPDPVPL